MYRVLLFYKHGYDYHEEICDSLCSAEDYYYHIVDEMEYEGCPVYLVAMYLDKMKIKEFRTRKEVIYVQ